MISDYLVFLFFIALICIILLFVIMMRNRRRYYQEIERLEKRLSDQQFALEKVFPPIKFKKPPPYLLHDDDYWWALSNWYRSLKNWTCEECGINLEDDKYFLHTHHIYGRSYNDPKYLKALCIGCHAEQKQPYNHDFMKEYKNYKGFIRKFKD